MSDLLLEGDSATEQLGEAIARTAPWSAPRALTVFLQGELGAGKTTLARGLLRALGEQGPVRSPSYALVESYLLAGFQVLHVDLYRLAGADELAALGLRDELRPGVMLLVEWPERAAAALPTPDMRITLTLQQQRRSVRLESATVPGAAWVSAVLEALQIQK